MFSQEERTILNNHQLQEVICQLRFPDILMLNQQQPAQFQDQIRDIFPKFSVLKETPPPKLSGAPGNVTVESQPSTPNYQFISEDGLWKVNLTSKFISLSCRKYTCWEEFAKMLDKPLAAFIQQYHPAYFTRVGLRYINIISRQALGLAGTPYRELIQPEYLGLLANEDVIESSATGCQVDAQIQIRGGCRLKVHAAPTLFNRNGTPESDTRFILDLDLFMPGNVAINMSTGALNALHSQAFGLFRGAITETLFDAMR